MKKRLIVGLMTGLVVATGLMVNSGVEACNIEECEPLVITNEYDGENNGRV